MYCIYCIFVSWPHTLQLFFFNSVLSFIPSKKKDIRTLFRFLRKMSTFSDLSKSNVFVDSSYF